MEKLSSFPFKVVGASVALILSLASIAFTIPLTHKSGTQECRVEISSPKPGSKVRRDALVSGTAKIPANGYLWILAHKKGLKGWWPQGGGEVDISEGNWDILVKFGEVGEIGVFEIAAVIVDKQTNEDLKRWVEDAPKNKYLPTSFPNPLQNCPVIKITVDKVGD